MSDFSSAFQISDITLVFLIMAAVVALFIWDRLPVVAVCMGCALSLWASGLLTLHESLAGFGDPATVFVASLFVLSAAIDKTGITAWIGQALMRGAGQSRTRLVVLMILFVAPLSALITVNGSVAALLPVVVVLAVRLARPPSQLLMPLVFGGHAGSMLALTGTPVNVLVVEAAQAAGYDGFGYFSFALVGIPLTAGVLAISVFLGERLLPKRDSRQLPPDLSDHARTLIEQFRLGDDLHQLRVRAESPSSGRAAPASPCRRARGCVSSPCAATSPRHGHGSARCRAATSSWCRGRARLPPRWPDPWRSARATMTARRSRPRSSTAPRAWPRW